MASSLLSALHLSPSPNPNQSHRKSPSLTPSSSQENPQTHLLHNFKTPFELKQIHSQIIKTNQSLSILPITRIASICAFSPDFPYSRSIFQRGNEPELRTWNTCLRGLSEGDSPVNAIRLFYQLRQADIEPNNFTCSFVLKACSLCKDICNGRIVHGVVEKLGFSSDLFLGNTILHMYACCGETEDAMKLFDKMRQRDVVSWNILITHLSKVGKIDEAQGLFDEMPKRSVRSWTAMIAGYVQCGKAKEAVRIFTEMEEAGKRPNEVTVVAILAACADLGELDLGRRIHEYSDRRGYLKNVRVCNTLMDMYIKCGCLEVARQVFDETKNRSVVSWSAMIGGLAMHGHGDEALRLFREMSRIGIRPNAITFIGLLLL